MSFGAKSVLPGLKEFGSTATAIYTPVYLTATPHILESLVAVYIRSYGYYSTIQYGIRPTKVFFLSNPASANAMC